MTERSIVSRVVLPTLAVAVTTSVIAIAITYATAWRNNLWAWLAVGVLTLIGAGASVWLYRQQADPAGTDPASPSNKAKFGRKSDIGTIRQVAGKRNFFKSGAKTRIDFLEMRAGAGDPQPAAEVRNQNLRDEPAAARGTDEKK